MKRTLDRRTLIGVAERVDLPEWGVTRMRAKIDTGARTSALHVDEIEELDRDRVRFSIVQHKDDHDERVTVEAPVVRRGRVRSSTGRVQERIYVRTRISIGGVEKDVEISLASRERMIFRMLLGRTALGDDFLVDPSRRYVCSSSGEDEAKRAKRKKARRKKTRRKKTKRETTRKRKRETEKEKRERKTTKGSGKKAGRVSARKKKKTKRKVKRKLAKKATEPTKKKRIKR